MDFEGKLFVHVKERLKMTTVAIKRRVSQLTGSTKIDGGEQAFGFAGQEYANGVQTCNFLRQSCSGHSREVS